MKTYHKKLSVVLLIGMALQILLRQSVLPGEDGLLKSLMAQEIVKAAEASETPDYQSMRLKWLHGIVGDDFDINDVDIQQKIISQTNTALTKWNSMIKTEGRTRLWEEYDLTYTATGIDMQSTFQSLKYMATAYRLKGSALYMNQQLRDDIVNGLIFLQENVYNVDVKYIQTGNVGWYYWEIGAPLNILDCLVLMHDDLEPSCIEAYVNAIKHFSPDLYKLNFGKFASTGANLLWKCSMSIISGVLTENAGMIDEAVEAIREALYFADQYNLEDGFYTDGSYVQHRAVSYNGAYGASAFGQIVDLMFFLNDTPFEMNYPEKDNIYHWAFNAFAPLLYNGSMMDMTRGRTVVRSDTTDRTTARGILKTFFKLSVMAPEDYRIRLQSIIKQNLLVDAADRQSYIVGLPVYFIEQAKEMLYGEEIPEALLTEETRVFAGMDRAVYRNENFAFGISMFSERQYSYEYTTVSGENKRGFYTGFGATYLYNKNLKHYSSNYWPTVDPYYLAGTTVTDIARSDAFGANRYGGKSWAGGVALDGRYGAVGMELEDYKTSTEDTPMTAKKSWFMFDNQIVALGADISSINPLTAVRTVVENRIIDKKDVITVDGLTKAFGVEEELISPQYVHIGGQKADIGYYFLDGNKVQMRAKEREGRWSDIAAAGSTTVYKNPFLTLSIEHGKAPRGESYGYVILPERTAQETAAYAGEPEVEVLENSSLAAAVKNKKLNITGVNFWSDSLHQVGGVTSSGKGSVMMQEQDGILKLAVADPTQKGDHIEIEIDKAVCGIQYADPRFQIIQMEPKLKLSVNVAGLQGHGISAAFQSDVNASGLPVTVDTTVTGLVDEKLPQKGYIILNHTMHQQQEAELTPVIVIATYERNKLVDVMVTNNVTIERGLAGTVNKSVLVNDINKIKIFTLKDLAGLQPYAKAFEITK